MEIFVEKAVDQSRAKLATRLAFIAAGFGVACWAPLVPYAKARCQVGDGTMGLILLLLGAGSILAMPIAANLCARFGSKPVVLSGGVGLAIVLPLLSIASSPITLGTALFIFGASLGSLDVAMNLHAVDAERVSEKPFMSGFHALFSIGGFLGSGVITALLSRNIAPSISTILSSAVLVLLIALAQPRMLSNRESDFATCLCCSQGRRPCHRLTSCDFFSGRGCSPRLERPAARRRTIALSSARRVGIYALLHRDDF